MQDVIRQDGFTVAGFSTQHICIVKRVRCGFRGANVLIGAWEEDLEVLFRLATTVAEMLLCPCTTQYNL